MKKVYKLVHKRFIEFSTDTNEKVYCTKLLGFFSSKQKCRDIINCYLQKPGFKDFPNDFQEEIVYADTDDFNGSIGEFRGLCFIWRMNILTASMTMYRISGIIQPMKMQKKSVGVS